jgi:hypothetical protein
VIAPAEDAQASFEMKRLEAKSRKWNPVEFQGEIDAPAEKVAAFFADCAIRNKVQPMIKSCDKVEKENGDYEQTVQGYEKTITLQSLEREGNAYLVRWTILKSQNLRYGTGFAKFAPKKDDPTKTEVTYHVDHEPISFLAGLVQGKVEKGLEGAMDALKSFSETAVKEPKMNEEYLAALERFKERLQKKSM